MKRFLLGVLTTLFIISLSLNLFLIYVLFNIVKDPLEFLKTALDILF